MSNHNLDWIQSFTMCDYRKLDIKHAIQIRLPGIPVGGTRKISINMGGSSSTAAPDVDMTGKVVIVTGSSAGEK